MSRPPTLLLRREARLEGEWRCRKCGTLLATTAGQRIHVSHKGAQFVVGGEQYDVIAVCRTCSTVNEREYRREGTVPTGFGAVQPGVSG